MHYAILAGIILVQKGDGNARLVDNIDKTIVAKGKNFLYNVYYL